MKLLQHRSITSCYARSGCIWVELRVAQAVLDEVAATFKGVDPPRPLFRAKIDATRQRLLTTREKLLELHGMDVELRDPLEEDPEDAGLVGCGQR